MEKLKVRDLMVPLDEYATVSQDSTLYEAVLALEKAQEKLDRDRYMYLHRAILVFDGAGEIVGKVSQLDVLRALEPKYQEMGTSESISRAGFSPNFLKSMLEQYSILADPLAEICSKSARLIVKDFMYTPTEGEYVKEDAALNVAIHQLVMGRHQSLLVTGDDHITGVLRLTDVFKYVFHSIKQCRI